jgi:2-succinyl-5-enolpyruvyl-6-hydroxy-3-cyclohexene-1-carboxylate synthase
MTTGAANTRAARAFVSSLARAGVADACVTPGSRSTPLTLALAEQGAIKPWLHIDERSAAFFGLGLAKATGRPVALVCTSGTAAANYLPAVAEANLGRVPLIVCTTDRPPHLRGAGAPQTMAQVGLYSSHVKWAIDLPLPGRDDDFIRFAAFAERAVVEAITGRAGPVHVNLPFDEPLVETPGKHEAAPPGVQGGPPPARPVVVPAEETIAEVASSLRGRNRPLIVAGPETGGLPAESIVALSTALGAPILADPLSGLRTGCHDRSGIIVTYDAFLRAWDSSTKAPDAVIRFGAVPTSKALNTFLAQHREAMHVLCDLPGDRRDPDALTSHFVAGDPADICSALARRLAPAAADGTWMEQWLRVDRVAAAAMREAAMSFDEPFEGRVFIELAEALPTGATIVSGSSMPVRDMDSFLGPCDKKLSLMANRGVNGIDGVTSTALGVAAAAAGPTVLVIGDLSFYHDLSGLWAAKRHEIDLTVVLVNNDGGGIFHYLPQAAHEHHFEEWWGTPSGLDFSHATRLFCGEHIVADTWETFRDALPGGRGHGLRVIEVRTDRARNVVMHREAWASAARAASGEARSGR